MSKKSTQWEKVKYPKSQIIKAGKKIKMEDLSPEERPKIGALVNSVRDDIEAKIKDIEESLERKAMEAAQKDPQAYLKAMMKAKLDGTLK